MIYYDYKLICRRSDIMSRPKKITVEEVELKLKMADDIIARQQELIEELQAEIEKLTAEKHNARGAGRKQKYDSAIIEQAKQLHKQGLSYGDIAKELNLSKSTVYKLIKER